MLGAGIWSKEGSSTFPLLEQHPRVMEAQARAWADGLCGGGSGHNTVPGGGA